MEIATNAVLAALLAQMSSFVKDAGVPLAPPIEPSKVQVFGWYVGWGREGEELRAYVRYEGGYEFRHNKGCINSFDTRNAYMEIQNPGDLDRLLGEAKFNKTECLARARDVIRRL